MYYGIKHWSSWTSAGALGTGTEFINRCTPACAAGHFRTYPVSIRLWRPRVCSNHVREFTRLTARTLTTGRVRTLTNPWGFIDHVTCP
jgi:hypothetical protein